jgi:hypothetical protein
MSTEFKIDGAGGVGGGEYDASHMVSVNALARLRCLPKHYIE